MAQILNKYQCPMCAHGWERITSIRTPDRCGSCLLMTCLPYESQVISRLIYTWRCQSCNLLWEGELHDCRCGGSQDRMDLFNLRFESEGSLVRIAGSGCGRPSRQGED